MSSPIAKILVVGAGALGCEILSKLAISGFTDLTIVDMDTIELSNLTRQYLFRLEHIGQYKASIAASQIHKMYPSVTCHYMCCQIESLPMNFFTQFCLVICGVDTVETRQWLNGQLYNLPIIIPMIEAGTEGWMGHVRLVIPKRTACLYCTRYLYDEQGLAPICTLSGVPRNAEQIVAWAMEVYWPTAHEEEFNPKEANHVQDLTDAAIDRAREYGIHGVTEDRIKDILKRVIPTLVCTTSLIAGLCVLITAQCLSEEPFNDMNYWFYNGQSGLFLESHQLERDPNCPVCKDYKTIQAQP